MSIADAFDAHDATGLAALVAGGDVSPTELLDEALSRVDARNPALNAIASLNEGAARRMISEGLPDGPFKGVPFLLKDIGAEAVDFPVSSGSALLKGAPCPGDSRFYEKLRAAGLVTFGRTTSPEFGVGPATEAAVYGGPTRNPWNTDHTSGGSSGGAAAVVAGGILPVAHASDGAGSIRMPAHFCGIFGLKPTYGRVPHIPVSQNDYATYIGPMSRTAADSALMLKVMAGPHHLDHTSCEAPPADYPALLDAPLKGRRIAYSPDYGHARVDPDVAEQVAKAVKTLEDLGAEVEEFTPAWGPKGPEIGRFFWSVLWGRRAGVLEEFEDRMSPDLVACMREGANYSANDYLNWRERKYAYVAEIAETLAQYDFLVSPAVSVAAFPVERVQPAHWPEDPWNWLAWAEFSYPFDMSGDPACSVPCGFTPAGLPVGLQIVARRFDDLGVLQAAHALEQALGIMDRRPPLPG